MTGYTVHTGANKKFVSGWDRVFGPEDGANAQSGTEKKSAAKKPAAAKKDTGGKKKKK
ncbi:MAG: hypothetical protein KDA89_05355 [Planctomycetaceae bacterium]|nr:hypothetical protein [Planctomycetaceae bacterium]